MLVEGFHWYANVLMYLPSTIKDHIMTKGSKKPLFCQGKCHSLSRKFQLPPLLLFLACSRGQESQSKIVSQHIPSLARCHQKHFKQLNSKCLSASMLTGLLSSIQLVSLCLCMCPTETWHHQRLHSCCRLEKAMDQEVCHLFKGIEKSYKPESLRKKHWMLKGGKKMKNINWNARTAGS